MKTEAELFAIANELGLTAECAIEMVAESMARQSTAAPRYVRLALNRAASVNGGQFKINCTKTRKFLDVHFGFNAENVHSIANFLVNRNKATSEWYVA